MCVSSVEWRGKQLQRPWFLSCWRTPLHRERERLQVPSHTHVHTHTPCYMHPLMFENILRLTHFFLFFAFAVPQWIWNAAIEMQLKYWLTVLTSTYSALEKARNFNTHLRMFCWQWRPATWNPWISTNAESPPCDALPGLHCSWLELLFRHISCLICLQMKCRLDQVEFRLCDCLPFVGGWNWHLENGGANFGQVSSFSIGLIRRRTCLIDTDKIKELLSSVI